MMRGRTGVALIFAFALLTGACGGSPTAPTPPTTGPTTLTGTVTAYGISSQSFTPTTSGSYIVTLTWTGTSDLDLYVTASNCTGYPPDACSVLARSTSSSGTREEVTLTMTAGTALLVWIDNFGLSTTTYTVVVRSA